MDYKYDQYPLYLAHARGEWSKDIEDLMIEIIRQDVLKTLDPRRIITWTNNYPKTNPQPRKGVSHEFVLLYKKTKKKPDENIYEKMKRVAGLYKEKNE